MQAYFGFATIVLLIALVISRTLSLKMQGIEALEFGKKDFFILPFALFYIYLLTANAFNLPTVPNQELFHSGGISRLGIFACLLAILLFLWTLVSFKKSFRVGLVENKAQGLITGGAFAVSRNPIYVSFAIMLAGQFLIFPSWILLVYLFLAITTFHRQVLKEENFLREQYPGEFDAYCTQVRRYL